MRRVARAIRTVGILFALFGIGFLGFYSLSLSRSRLGSEPAKLTIVTSVPSPSLKGQAAPSTPSGAAGSALTDQSVQHLAYAAASGDKAARDTLEAQAAKDVPAAEYGLGLFYFTKAQELSPITPCFAPSGDWLRKHSPEAARAQGKMQSAAESELDPDKIETKKLCETAMSWFEKAASAEDHAAQAKVGQEFYSAAAHLKIMALAAFSNDNPPSDQEIEDELNKGGNILKVTCAEAIRSLNQAAAAHESNAESTLAGAYMAGVGCVKRDNQKALYWDRKAHDDGKFSASVDLASLYWEAGNFSDAQRWITTAEREGTDDEETAWSIVQYYKLGNINEEKAAHWRERAESLDEEEDEKYPALKLIHEKETEAARQEPAADE